MAISEQMTGFSSNWILLGNLATGCFVVKISQPVVLEVAVTLDRRGVLRVHTVQGRQLVQMDRDGWGRRWWML